MLVGDEYMQKGRERPKNRWLDVIKSNKKKAGVSIDEDVEDRVEWKLSHQGCRPSQIVAREIRRSKRRYKLAHFGIQQL